MTEGPAALGALLGGLMVGLMEAWVGAYLGGEYKLPATFALLMAVLVARPHGLFGTVEIERLTDVLSVGRPAYGQPESTVGLFRLSPDGATAERVQVVLGRASVTSVEVRRGLKPGDRVIVSDVSQWDAHDKLRIK